MITADQLKKIAPNASLTRIAQLLPLINEATARYSINTPLRMAHFLAQILHESGSLHYMEEIASGSAYEGRRDLGNFMAGDGKKFKGRGLMQLTGRANYEEYGKAIKTDLTARPELVATKYPVDVAGWFWQKKNLNALADADDITTITKRINGGLNGFAERKAFLDRAKQVFGI